MEKQRSSLNSMKPTRFLLLSFTTLLFSVIIFTFLSIWIVKSSPSYLKHVNSQILTDNFSINRVEDAILTDTPSKKPQNTTRVTATSGGERESTVMEDEKILSGFGGNFSVDSDFASNPFQRSENETGVSPISDFEEQWEESEELEDEDEDDEDLASPEPSNRVEVEKIEVNDTDASSIEKIEVTSNVAWTEEKKNGTDSIIESLNRVEVEKIEVNDTDASSIGKFEVPSNVVMTDEKKNGSDPIIESAARQSPVIEEKRANTCDVTKGRWVYDESYPMYTNDSCPFIDEGFNCQSNGRLDKDYMKWKWKPDDCDIPRFDVKQMLELLRGKRLVFVGDSINRNQWESMLCMLMQGVEDPNRVYETHGRRITKEKGNYCFKFVDYKCTVEYYVSHFLVHESKARIGQKRKPTLRIDAIDRGSSRWRGADILIFNTAHWWSHSKTKSGINYYQDKDRVYPQLDVSTAFRRALMTWASWVDKYINQRKTRVFFRSSSPSHFSGGQWNSGGHCTEATRPLNQSFGSGYPEKNIIAEEVVKQMKTRVTILNITGLSGYRIDGHPSVYGRQPRNKRVQDCSHWCLPGVPDIWNELLYFHLQSKLTNSLR